MRCKPGDMAVITQRIPDNVGKLVLVVEYFGEVDYSCLGLGNLPVAITGAGVGVSYGAFRYYRLRKKLQATAEGEEAQFTETEAKVIEWLLRRFAKKAKHDDA